MLALGTRESSFEIEKTLASSTTAATADVVVGEGPGSGAAAPSGWIVVFGDALF